MADPASLDPADPRAFRTVLGHFCSGVTVVAGMHDGEPVGMTAQSFTSVSLDPPLVAFCPANTAGSWQRIRESGAFCVNVLALDQAGVARTFATRGADKFADVRWSPGATGSPLIEGSIASIDCTIDAVHPAGDHAIVVGRVVSIAVDADRADAPLLFFRGAFGAFRPDEA